MNAERILLTHFSQRYPKIPTLHEDGAPTGAGTRERRVCIAFDCMSVAFHRLRWLPLLLPSFKWLFPPETAEPANASLGAE
jgi:ribonuclease Z